MNTRPITVGLSASCFVLWNKQAPLRAPLLKSESVAISDKKLDSSQFAASQTPPVYLDQHILLNDEFGSLRAGKRRIQYTGLPA